MPGELKVKQVEINMIIEIKAGSLSNAKIELAGKFGQYMEKYTCYDIRTDCGGNWYIFSIIVCRKDKLVLNNSDLDKLLAGFKKLKSALEISDVTVLPAVSI